MPRTAADSFADYRWLTRRSLKIMRNLPALLARRLILANAKVDLLSAYRRRQPRPPGCIRSEGCFCAFCAKQRLYSSSPFWRRFPNLS
jgi:hypothetical protein